MDALNRQKQELRRDLKLRRSGREYDPELASSLCVHLAELCLKNGATRVACYLAFGNEPDTELFIDWAIENAIEVVLPISNEDGSLSWVIFEGESAPGIFGFAEPVGLNTDLVGTDIIFIPALAVDQTGQRIGKGKGYYDRALATLENVAPVVAVVYEEELLERIPTENHDHPVDAVVTPSGITFFSDRLN
jgi:5-formyltetrahydrofolate cyclo-ligase